MDWKVGTRSFNRIQRRSARQASPSVDAYGGHYHAYIYHCFGVIFFRPMGHYVRDIYSI
jgi:hypothetical protein